MMTAKQVNRCTQNKTVNAPVMTTDRVSKVCFTPNDAVPKQTLEMLRALSRCPLRKGVVRNPKVFFVRGAFKHSDRLRMTMLHQFNNTDMPACK